MRSGTTIKKYKTASRQRQAGECIICLGITHLKDQVVRTHDVCDFLWLKMGWKSSEINIDIE